MIKEAIKITDAQLSSYVALMLRDVIIGDQIRFWYDQLDQSLKEQMTIESMVSFVVKHIMVNDYMEEHTNYLKLERCLKNPKWNWYARLKESI